MGQNLLLMKKTIFYLSAVLVSFFLLPGCKKNSSAPQEKEYLLSKVYHNGKLEYSYEYNDKNQLSKITGYDVLSGKTDYFQEFYYDRKNIKAIHSFDGNGKATGIQKFSSDLAGNITKSDFIDVTGADSGEVVNRITYTWDKKGHLIKETWADLLSGKPTSYRANTWYDNGNLKSSTTYGSVNPDVLWWSTEYSPGNALPESLAGHTGYLINFEYYYLVSEEVHNKIEASGGGPKENIEKMSKRKYNEQGLLTEQTISTENITPALLSAQYSKKYDYIEVVSYHF